MLMKYYKGEPNSYVLRYRHGKLAVSGVGINFFYLPMISSIVVLPLASQECPFIFNETTIDFQEIAIQGSVGYRVIDPEKLAARLNFEINPGRGDYRSDDPDKLIQRVVNSVQAYTRSEVSQLSLEAALTQVKDLASMVFEKVTTSTDFAGFGLALESLHFTAIKATPEMQKALEADYREGLHKRADQAIYDRRKAAVDEERKIRESEINTDIELEVRRKDLVDLQSRNNLALAQAEAKAEEMKLAAYGALSTPALVGLALKEWAGNAGTIDSLSITPDLLAKAVAYVSDNGR